jgi:probable rRNA maturation factor
MDPEGRTGSTGRRRPPRALRVLVGAGRGRGARSAPSLARWLKEIAPAGARGTVGVAVVSDARVRALNRRYRGVDRATDVLSFSPGPGVDGVNGLEVLPGLPGVYIGDIVIARGVARRQARDAGHSELTEWRVLALHGLLHLLGYDHERDRGRMRRVERRLRRQGGLPDGLIERAGRL